MRTVDFARVCANLRGQGQQIPIFKLMEIRDTRYAKTPDGVYIAYQVGGAGCGRLGAAGPRRVQRGGGAARDAGGDPARARPLDRVAGPFPCVVWPDFPWGVKPGRQHVRQGSTSFSEGWAAGACCLTKLAGEHEVAEPEHATVDRQVFL